MKVLRNPWVLAVLAILSGMGAQAGFIVMKLGLFENVYEEDRQPSVPAPSFAPATLSWSFITPAVEELREELEKRLAAAASREKELEEYENRLASERGELEKLKLDLEQRKQVLETMRAEFLATILEVKEEEQKNLKTLAATYSTLAPGAALAIFREMEDEAVVKILAFMKPDPVGQILQEMALTKDGGGTLAGRAAIISNKLRLKRQARAEEDL